jgi:hypothetical protein
MAAAGSQGNRSDVTTEGMIAAGHCAGGLATVGLSAQNLPLMVPAVTLSRQRPKVNPRNTGSPAPSRLPGA